MIMLDSGRLFVSRPVVSDQFTGHSNAEDLLHRFNVSTVVLWFVELFLDELMKMQVLQCSLLLI